MKSPRSIRSTPLMRNGPLRTAKRIKTGTRNNTPLFKQIRPAAVTAGRIFCCGVEVAGVEPNTIHTDNQQYIQTQKIAPTKTPRD